MSRFVITAIGLDSEGHIERVIGAELNVAGDLAEAPVEVPVENIVFALERGDEVRARFDTDPRAPLGSRFRLTGAPGKVELEEESDGRALVDMPRIKS